MIALALCAFALIAALDVPRYLRAAEYRELARYCLPFFISLALCLLFAWDVKIPTPMEFLLWLCGDVLGIHYGHY